MKWDSAKRDSGDSGNGFLAKHRSNALCSDDLPCKRWLTNWCREIRKMSKLSVTKVHGAGRTAALRSWINDGGVAVTTYETTGYFKVDDNFKFSTSW